MKRKIDSKIIIMCFLLTTSFSCSQKESASHPLQEYHISVNGETIEMVLVEEGTFDMGCTPEQEKDASENEKPAHSETVQSFYIGKYEVTQKLWNAVLGSENNHSYNTGCEECPVENVSWDDVQAFIARLTILTQKKFRLPSDIEWEYAARGGNRSKGYKYSGSNNINEVGWYIENYQNKPCGEKKTTHTVGLKQSNELGLYDMSGNVWEWCNNLYQKEYVQIGLSACNQQTDTTDLITIDVETKYPEKKLMLQDFADVEYIALETTDEFINKGIVGAIGEKHIAITNAGSEGTIFLYDRKTGKGLRKINRKGQGGEEYTLFTEIILDEKQNEMFVVDYPKQTILVYNLEGDFLRRFKFAENSYYNFTFNYDKNHLLTYKGYSPHTESEKSAHILISKQDGSIVREFNFPYKEIKTPVYTGMHEKYGEVVVSPMYFLTTHGNDNDWYMTRSSSDTLYHCLADGSIHPCIVRTPAIHEINPEVFLFPFMMTDRYMLVQTLEKKVNKSRLSYPSPTMLGYDKEEKAVYQFSFYNADYPEKAISFYTFPKDNVMMYQSLQAPELIEAYQSDKLQGKLKEIAATLDEDSNAVIALIKHRK